MFAGRSHCEDGIALGSSYGHRCSCFGYLAIEIANIFLMSEKSGRITEAGTLASVQFLNDLQVLLDFNVISDAFSTVLFLAREYSLTVYDATYLELALRRRLPLATNDRPLQIAAGRAGVEIV